MHKLRKIISGGQTGVDQAALRVALELGLETGGWCPPDRACESGTIPEHFPLVPTPVERSPNAPHIPRSLRTEWNVRDSDATLVLVPDTIQNDAGTNWTIECAKRYSKPVCAINPFSSDASVKIYNWLSSLDISTLNVAGPSEKTCTGIGTIAEKILRKAFLLSSSKLKLVSAMEPQATESLSDYELERGKPMPNFNHGYIQANLIVALRARYG
ncbi:MAG: putative molybdenum carrier protein [Chloroherpetonaceae bacterium]|nr:putative molybdenum carrier protein [Chloroherpetonaceae bacterium]